MGFGSFCLCLCPCFRDTGITDVCCHIQLFVWVSGVKLRPAGFSGKHFTCGALSLVPEVFFEGSIYELIEDMQRIESEQGEQKFQSSRRKGVGGRANT